MMVTTQGSVIRLLFWQWKSVLFFGLWASFVFGTFASHVTWFTIPSLPIAVAGGALGIFVSFRTNSAYDRWWEGRKLWGRLINTSRHFTSQVVVYLPKDSTEMRDGLVRRHLAYVNALRCLLRTQDPFKDEHTVSYLTEDERENMTSETNLTHALLHRQLDTLTRLSNDEGLDAFRLQSLDESIRHLLDIQGGCERIKKTPLPRGYGFIASRLILAFSILFPFTIVHDVGWLVIPINVLVCLAFTLISEAGRVLEDPFTMFWNGLPLTAISRTIEANCLQRIEAAEIPAIPGPNQQGILM